VPDRYLREAILRSERIGSLTTHGLTLFYKLLSLVDDYGCYDGREYVIASQAYWRFGPLTPALRELHERDCIVRYLNADKHYLAIMQWGDPRRGRRKWPAPPICNDLPGLEYVVPFNQAPNWRNPLGCDRVSVLLDLDLKPVTPQPGEWRRVASDWLPIGSTPTQKVHERKERTPRSAQHAAPVRSPSTLAQAPGKQPGPVDWPSPPSSSSSASSSASSSSSSASLTPTPGNSETTPDEDAHASTLAQSAAPTTPPTNGIKYVNGAWQGLSEEQRLKWQGIFPAISIPDQVDRAAAWLQAHPEKHEAFGKDDNEHAFLVRWLLRESRANEASATGSTRAKADA
jgi:hypothetical protein